MKKILLFAFLISVSFATQAQATTGLTKTAWLTNNTGKVMQAYPNPATDQVIIQHVSSPVTAVMSVINSNGRVLQQHTVVPNTLQTTLHIGLLDNGIYIVRFEAARGDIRTLQLVKK
ncbi:MAG: T9SS type A sorting domain-containing protein [Chitinophagaceae bacterium]|nr:T9SS type A sorting domain-containing protein [Chitinophagaceae bacterium]